jgi:hypothetical protein
MMDKFWEETKANGGVCGAEHGLSEPQSLNDIRNDYRWTPKCQRAFLEALVCTGSVSKAAREVGKSPRSVYDLQFRRCGKAFKLGSEAAILISRRILEDTLLDRAVSGFEEVSCKDEDGRTVRGKFDNRLSMNVLARLDRIAERQALAHSNDAQVQLVVSDFEAFLDLIEKGGTGADAAIFCAARSSDDSESEEAEKAAIDCELARISAAEKAEAKRVEEAVPDMLDEEPAVAAERLSIWFDGFEWRTNFPLPDNADAAELDEGGLFGDPHYDRKLTPEEEEAHIAAVARERAPWHEAAAAARDAWLGMKEAA